MNIKQRISKLEQSENQLHQPYQRVICEENETTDQACERLGIVDQEHIIFRVIVSS